MKKNSDIYNFFKTDVCLTPELLQKYLSNELEGEEFRRVENHLLDCDMCADAVEGWSLAGAENIIPVTENLNRKIDNSGFKITFRKVVYMVAAASVIFMLGIFAYLQIQSNGTSLAYEAANAEKENEDVPVTETTKTIEQKEKITTDTIYENEQTEKKQADEKLTNASGKSLGREQLAVVPKAEESTKDLEHSVIQDIEIKEEDNYAEEENEVLLDDVISVNKDKAKGEGTLDQPSKSIEKTDLRKSERSKNEVAGETIESKKESKRKLKSKKSRARSEDMSEMVLDEISEELSTEPTVIPSLTDTISEISQLKNLYEQKKYSAALSKVDSLLKTEKMPDYLWYKALILIELNKEPEATKILEELSLKENLYQEQSKEK
jgi:hypothetical protein